MAVRGGGNQNPSAKEALFGLSCHQAVSRDGLEGYGPRRTFRSLERLTQAGAGLETAAQLQGTRGRRFWPGRPVLRPAGGVLRALVGILCVYKCFRLGLARVLSSVSLYTNKAVFLTDLPLVHSEIS